MINFNDRDLNEFLKHAKNYISASFFLKGLAFLSIPIITYLLSPEEYGKIGVFSSLTSILVIILSLNSFTSIIRYYHEYENRIFEFIWTLILFQIPFLIIVSLLIYNNLDKLLLEKFNIGQDIFIGSLITACLFIFTRFYLSYLQTSQQSKLYNKISSIRGLFLLILTISLYYFLKSDKYLGRIYSEIFINAIVVIFVFISLLKVSKIKFDKSLLKYSLSYSIPLIPHSLSVILLNSSDRIILNQLHGSLETGIYTFAYQIAIILEIVIIGTNQSWVPIFFNRIKEKKFVDVEKLAIKYKKLIFFFASFLILYIGDIVKLVANKSYHASLNVIPIIIISYCFMFIYTIYGNYSLYSKKTFMIAINTSIAGALNIILNYQFIPEYGYMAAGVSTLISFFLLMILHYIFARYTLNIKTVSIYKLLNEIYWVLGAYGLFLACEFYIDSLLLIFLAKTFYIIFISIFMYSKIIRKLFIK